MKFIVEVDDFYLEDEELSVSLKHLIKNDVAAQIRESIRTKVVELTEKIFKEETQKGLEKRVAILIGEVSSTMKIKGGYSSDPEISIEEYIFKRFNETNLRGKTDELIESITKKNATALANDIKQRYDMLFASQLVQKMNEAGMLKESVAQLLLKKEDESLS